jgi:hypothetical protein
MISSFVTLYSVSYDTEHVRTGSDGPGRITGLPTFAALVDNPDLAALYTALRRETATTGPELVDQVDVSKKTVYDYLDTLEQAGLVTKTGTEGGTAVYEAVAFEMIVTVRRTAVSITPALVEVVAHRPEYPVIDRVLADEGLVTVALVHDLVHAHRAGDITIRQIADLADLSSGTAYDLVTALYSIHDLGDDSGPTTYTPAEFAESGDE